MDSISTFLMHGVLDASPWVILLYALITTHLTIVSVTIFLHRAQAHRALELHPIMSHVFRFWLWLGTGLVTREFVAVHRKHHAKCETDEDPHSPQIHGLRKLLLEGVELYRTEARIPGTLTKYGRHTPDDWIERNLYTRFSWQGVGIVLILDLFMFGAIGATVWAVQMIWIPWWATGVINGVGHYFGYRNFETPDASTNVSPWGILIGGEELHNNHHTYPTSAKFSVKSFELDIGWVYIRVMEFARLAQVRKIPPRLELGTVAAPADSRTLEAIIANRYEVMARYAAEMRRVMRTEFDQLRSEGVLNNTRLANMRLARRWLYRDNDNIPHDVRAQLADVLGESPRLAKLVEMREELRQLWTRTNASADQLVDDLRQWCHKAEASGIAALKDFSRKLRMVRT